MDPILEGMMTGRLHEFAQGTREMQRQAANNIAHAQGIIDRQHAEIVELLNHIAEMEKVRLAVSDGYKAELAAWRKEHPVSHMHDVVGRWSDGDGLRRNSRIRLDAYFESANQQGIRDSKKWVFT